MVELDFTKSEDGLIPAIAQDYKTGEVLMLAFINQQAWEHTLKSGNATYWSRSRSKLWIKGESSGHIQQIKEILVDCDNDAVVYKIDQIGGAACHTGHRTCFYRKASVDGLETVGEPVFDPDEVYNK